MVIHGPGHGGTRLALREGITTFGRLPSNDVLLLGDLVSRHHARVSFFEGRATLQDLGSHNGTWVNAERVTTRVLREGDAARIGNFQLTFHTGPVGEGNQGIAEDTTGAEIAPNVDLALLDQPSDVSQTDERRPSRLPTGYRPNRAKATALFDEIERLRSGAASESRASHLLYLAGEAQAKATSLKSYAREMLALVGAELPSDTAAFFLAAPDHPPELLAASSRELGDRGARVSMNVVRWVVTKNFAVTTDDVSSDQRFPRESTKTAVICVPIGDAKGARGAIYVARAATPFDESELEVLSVVAQLALRGMEHTEARREGLTRKILGRFHSPDVVEQLLAHARNPKPTLEGKTATVVAGDIHVISELVERVGLEMLTAFFNAYVDEISSIVLEHRGTLEPRPGTGFIAIFGAPFSYGNDAARGIGAALAMRDAFDGVAARFPEIGSQRLRIGVDTGWVVSGMAGTRRRLAFATLGEPIASALRIEASAAPGAILIGEATHSLIRDLFDLRKLGLQHIRGHQHAMHIYEVVGRASAAESSR